MPEPEELLTKEDKVRIKRCLYGLHRDSLPPITTHNVVDDWSDPILNAIRRCKLFNTVHDRVKVNFGTFPADILVLKSKSNFQNSPSVFSGCISPRIFEFDESVVRTRLRRIR